MRVNFALSRQLAEQVKAIPKECWRNAYLALTCLPTAKYVEGWAITASGLMVEHGWLEYEGEIVDPTFSLGDSREKLQATAYFPGVRYCLDEAMGLLAKRDGQLPLVWAHGWGGMDCPEYAEAYEQALSTQMSKRLDAPGVGG